MRMDRSILSVRVGPAERALLEAEAEERPNKPERFRAKEGVGSR